MKKDEKTKESVRDAYSRIATGVNSCCGSSSCCGSEETGSKLSEKLGYSADQLSTLPEGADLGLSCGNPFLADSLKEGETVLDLGCGGGFDVFIASASVGQSGRVIGVDMTPDMISLARGNAARFHKETGLANTEFRLGEIEHLPVEDNSVDIVISNCVINLSTEKTQVWREIARVLKPGGRISVSDILLLKPLPENIRKSVEAYVGCIAGAITLEQTEILMRNAGLVNIKIQTRSDYFDATAKGSGQLLNEITKGLAEGTSITDYVTSGLITGKKPE